MKIGVCVGTNIERARLAKEVGFDFIESHCQDIVKASEDELEALKNIGIPVVAANCFMGMRVVGRKKDEKAIREYLDKLFERASYLGMKYIVFGSSGARKMTDDEEMTLEGTRAEIVDFLKNIVAGYAEKYKICIAIEPLRHEECNVINTVEQGVEIAKKVASPYVKVLADVKHMDSVGEPLDSLGSYKGWLVHGHTSNPCPDESTGKKRTYPKKNDKFDQNAFFAPLKAAGVEQCSVEADVIDFDADVREAYEVLKELR